MNELRCLLRHRDRALRDEGAQALVEFALVVPLLLMLVVGVFEFGRAWNAYQVITDAAREGARTAVVHNPSVSQQDVMQTVERALARAALDPRQATIAIDGFRAGRHSPATVAVEYPYEFAFLGRLMGAVGFPSSVTLRTRFVMRNE